MSKQQSEATVEVNNKVEVNGVLGRLIKELGEGRMLDLYNKGLKYEKSRRAQCDSAKERRVLSKAAMEFCKSQGLTEEQLLDIGESTK